jgi:hypothetical protein
MKKKHLIPMLLVFIGLATISFMAKDGVTLRLRPQQDKTYTATSKANMMTMMEVQGQTMTMSQVYETRQSFTAKEVTDNQSIFEAQVEAIKMSISQMGMKLEYDSEHPEKTSPMLAGQTKEMEKTIKKPVTITYDALGNFIIPSDSIDVFENQMRDVVIPFPENELTVGSKWNAEKTQSISNKEITMNMEYTVTPISKKSVDVSFTGTVESPDLTGTYNGTASINPQTGLMTNGTTKSNLSMTINEQGLSIPTTIVSTSTIEVK